MFCGQRAVIHFEARDDVDEAERVPQLEGAQLVGVAPAHGAIDLDDAVGDLGDHFGRVEEQVAENFPQEAAGAIVGAQQGAQALAEVFDVAGGLDGSESAAFAAG